MCTVQDCAGSDARIPVPLNVAALMVNATQADFHNGIKNTLKTALRHYQEARGPNSSIHFTMTNTTVITYTASGGMLPCNTRGQKRLLSETLA